MRKYFLIDLFTGKSYEVDEKEFFRMVGANRSVVPVRHVNGLQKFYLQGECIGYIER